MQYERRYLVQVWRVDDGKPLATMEAEHVQCVAFSRDGKWIAAGTFWGDVMVGTLRYTTKSSRRGGLTTPSEVLISSPTLPDSSHLVATQLPSGASQPANELSVHSATRIMCCQRNTRSRVIELRQQRWPLAHGHTRTGHHTVQHRSPLVQQQP